MNRLSLLFALLASAAMAGCGGMAYKSSGEPLDLGRMGMGMRPVRTVELETGRGTAGGTGQPEDLEKTDEEVARILKRNAPMKIPGRLAVAELEWIYRGEGSIPARSVPLDPEARESLRTTLGKTIYFSSVSFLPPALLSYQGGTDIPALRKAAARVNADFLLVLIRESDRRGSMNPMAVTYLAILPAGFIPGSNYTVHVKETGLLIDVRNGRIYSPVSAEAKRDWMGPIWWLDKTELHEEARVRAVEALADELVRQLATVRNTDDK